jgi:hypothetical protein
MLAPANPHEIRPPNPAAHHLGTRLPLPVFQAAYKELCTRIWIELELLAQANTRPPQDLTMSTAILRLELVVLIDSCRSPRWRHLLTTEQRDSLCSMLTDVLAALYVDPDHLHTALPAAQDRVLDELLPEPHPIPHEFSQAFPTPIHELVSLIEAQAVARALQ